jgi:hypothetical protein
MRSSEASVAPAGPLPMMPTVLMVVLIITRILVYGPVAKKNYLLFSVRQVNPKTDLPPATGFTA